MAHQGTSGWIDLNSGQDLVRFLVHQSGKHQSSIAKALRRNHHTVNDWYTGTASPKLDDFMKLCEVAGFELKLVPQGSDLPVPGDDSC